MLLSCTTSFDVVKLTTGPVYVCVCVCVCVCEQHRLLTTTCKLVCVRYNIIILKVFYF